MGDWDALSGNTFGIASAVDPSCGVQANVVIAFSNNEDGYTTFIDDGTTDVLNGIADDIFVTARNIGWTNACFYLYSDGGWFTNSAAVVLTAAGESNGYELPSDYNTWVLSLC